DGKYVAKLNADGSHQKTGPAITLRVMAGDTISIGVNAFFKSTGRNKSKHPLNKGIANQLLQSLRGIGVGVNGHNNPATTGDMPAL
ncbi:hypothetical protein, partial [Chitinophaga sp. sic0106]|uniref:hypothetical protein n=1 Tax=Chitinophaga sp. sic0106 TaxID=2854785 RepID=UPI001C46D3E1